ncbi:MAG: hypothetical protein AAF380_02265 [Bacteroidota bacterium]
MKLGRQEDLQLGEQNAFLKLVEKGWISQKQAYEVLKEFKNQTQIDIYFFD